MSVTCFVPASLMEGNATIEVSLNAIEYSAQGFQVRLVSSPGNVLSVIPSFGSVGGGTSVSVVVSGMESARFDRCIFGDAQVFAVSSSSHGVTCRTPAQKSGTVQMQLCSPTVCIEAPSFEFVNMPSVLKIEPSSGPIGGGVTSKVFNSSISSSTVAFCKYGNTSVLARRTGDSSVLLCSSPAFHGLARLVSFEVGVDGVGSSSSGLSFLYYVEVVISSISPTRVPAGEARTLTISGSNFLSNARPSARFGSKYTSDAEWLSSTLIVTTSVPALPPGPHTLEVSNNGETFKASDIKVIVEKLSVFPSVGPALGGTQVTVHGHSFSGSSSYACSFRRSKSAAKFVSPDTLTCRLTASSEGVADFILHEDSDGHVTTSSPLDFLFTPEGPDIAISSLSPSLGPIDGTVMQISGSNFSPIDKAFCSFGQSVFEATFLSTTLVQCSVSATGPAVVEISLLSSVSKVLSEPLKFTFVEKWEVHSLRPSLVSDAATSTITVFGAGFVDSNAIRCRIGDGQVASGRFLSSTSVLCSLQQVKPGNYTVGVSCNAQEFSSHNVTLDVRAAPTVVELSPSIGNTGGGQVVLVGGTNFLRDLSPSCSFGGRQTFGTFVSDSLVRCSTPFQNEMG
eukprot:3112213-Rhodomonas_salina.1